MVTTEKKRAVIEKWYRRLEFNNVHDRAFFDALGSDSLADVGEYANYSFGKGSPMHDMLAGLYFCEEAFDKFGRLGVPDEVAIATLKDLSLWADTCREATGKSGITAFNWLSRHLEARIFTLGRLQFAFGAFTNDFPSIGAKKGDPLVEVHIPAAGRLDPVACDASFAMAERFFPKHFPDYKFDRYSCHSWLLDPTLKEILPPGSNILAFAARFEVLECEPSDGILGYVLRWGLTREELPGAVPKSAFAAAVKERIMTGGTFYSARGFAPRPTHLKQ